MYMCIYSNNDSNIRRFMPRAAGNQRDSPVGRLWLKLQPWDWRNRLLLISYKGNV